MKAPAPPAIAITASTVLKMPLMIFTIELTNRDSRRTLDARGRVGARAGSNASAGLRGRWVLVVVLPLRRLLIHGSRGGDALKDAWRVAPTDYRAAAIHS